MAFQSFLEKYKSFLTNWGKSASGEGTTETFDYKINTKQELNALQNASTINDMVQLSNGYYDQVGIGRAIKELYKTPKDYLADFKLFNETSIKQLDNLAIEVADSTTNVADTIEKSKSIKGISHKLQLKLSLIKSEFDA
jgi:hypothetical protein